MAFWIQLYTKAQLLQFCKAFNFIFPFSLFLLRIYFGSIKFLFKYSGKEASNFSSIYLFIYFMIWLFIFSFYINLNLCNPYIKWNILLLHSPMETFVALALLNQTLNSSRPRNIAISGSRSRTNHRRGSASESLRSISFHVLVSLLSFLKSYLDHKSI